MRLRVLVGAGLTVVGLLAGALAGSGAHADEPSREPVIILHGWNGTAAGMATMRDAFAAAGYPTYTINFPGQNNITNAQRIADLVTTVKAETGAEKVHLVAHSMGGLSARYYIKRLDGASNVRTYVSMGTSQYGYLPACLLGEQNGGQMCPANNFIRDLNVGDDTPGSVAYSTIRSTEDTANITRLDGGACFHEIAGVPHSAEPSSPPFIQAALTVLAGTCPGTFIELPIG